MFKSVTVLTYLFEGSLLAAYFRYYNIPFKVNKASLKDEQIKKEEIRKLLNIYEGSANNVGDYASSFCVNWLKNRTPAQIKKIKNSVANLLSRKFKSSSSNTGFTTFKAFKSKLKGKGYSNGFIPVNERATNEYSHKETMIYLANRYLNPNIIDFFRGGSVKVDEDQWALAELLQWIFRGSIRSNKKMNLYIPSKRMRTLLYDWLNEDTCVSIAKAA